MALIVCLTPGCAAQYPQRFTSATARAELAADRAEVAAQAALEAAPRADAAADHAMVAATRVLAEVTIAKELPPIWRRFESGEADDRRDGGEDAPAWTPGTDEVFGDYRSFCFCGATKYSGLTVIAKNGALIHAEAWSCTWHYEFSAMSLKWRGSERHARSMKRCNGRRSPNPAN